MKRLNNFTITPLRDTPQWLPLVSDWHQRQWPQDSVERRRQKLSLHLNDSPLPTTLLLFENKEFTEACVPHKKGERLDDQYPLGCISLVCYQRLGGMSPSHWVANLFVLPEWRRRGYGQRLLQAAAGCARQQLIDELYLYATDKVDYYRRLGWQVIRQKQVKGAAATIMCWSLTRHDEYLAEITYP